MFVRILLTALLAGALAGVFVFAAHMAKTSPLILHAEIYENAGSTHTHGATASAKENVSESEEWAPADGIERGAYTLLADLLTSIGFAFVLVGAIALSGRDVDWRSGMVWGFVVLPPSLQVRHWGWRLNYLECKRRICKPAKFGGLALWHLPLAAWR